ncbi:MAG: hypothetical protein ACM3H7_01025 [Acidobacteriaceae bacterium]
MEQVVESLSPVGIATDLQRCFEDKEVVAGASLSIGHGEIFGLLGPNGAGRQPPSAC